MKLAHSSAPYILHLLLLAELFVHSTARPAPSPSLCGLFGSMVHQVENLMKTKLHDLSSNERSDFGVTHKLHLPDIQNTASHFNSLKVNESLSRLYTFTQSFKLHVDWLKTTRDNFSLSSQSAEGASTHLLHMSNLMKTSLQQLTVDVPQSPPPSLPNAPSTAFDVLKLSIELSERLQVFSDWSKRVLRHLQRQSRCPRH